jgi:hypothetical protein
MLIQLILRGACIIYNRPCTDSHKHDFQLDLVVNEYTRSFLGEKKRVHMYYISLTVWCGDGLSIPIQFVQKLVIFP